MNKTFGVIGGDRRQTELAALLRADGRTVWTYGVGEDPELPEQAAAADVVILPLPLCREPGLLNWSRTPLAVGELFSRFQPSQLLLAGQVRPEERRTAEKQGLVLVDYFRREELTVKNAVATAWILRHPAGIQVLAGSMNPDRLTQMIAGADLELDRQEWYDLYRAAGNDLP